MSTTNKASRGAVTVSGLSKSFFINNRCLTVLSDFNLEVHSGEALLIVGASGSGKTTLLRVLAGLEDADSGDVLIDGHPVHGVGAERAVIFQEPRLLPWQTVLGNVAFGLEVRGETTAESRKVAKHYISLVGLSEFADAYPKQLSGGMAQRVGIARALAVQPELLLLDEPLGALDAMTKITMQEELSRIWRDENVTLVMVTHDIEEAIFLADRVLVLPKAHGGPVKLVDIDLPRPRERSSHDFVHQRQTLLREFGLH